MYKEIVVLIALETLLVCGIYCVTMPIQQDIDNLTEQMKHSVPREIDRTETNGKYTNFMRQISKMELTRNMQILIGFIVVLITCLTFYVWVKVLGWKDDK